MPAATFSRLWDALISEGVVSLTAAELAQRAGASKEATFRAVHAAKANGFPDWEGRCRMGRRREHPGGCGPVIPRPVLAAWRQIAPCRDDRQVAQDLILSILAIRAANHSLLGEHLVWRGGTCLHKLRLDRPRGYSEDLDYVLVGKATHGLIEDALREVVEKLGMVCVKVWRLRLTNPWPLPTLRPPNSESDSRDTSWIRSSSTIWTPSRTPRTPDSIQRWLRES